jgi:hypothetical protein
MIDHMEIRIILDRVEPPAGRLHVVPDHGRASRKNEEAEIGFAGWLGLLRALYEVTEERPPLRGS